MGPVHTSVAASTVAGPSPPEERLVSTSTALASVLVQTLVNTPTFALSVGLERILRNRALCDFFFPIVTPFRAERWFELIDKFDLADEFEDVPQGFVDGFSLGLEHFSLTSTFSPPNHYKSSDIHALVVKKYSDEITRGRISPGYPPAFLSATIGHYRTAPLHALQKEPGGKFRVLIDHSFPRNNPLITSINSNIDSKRFQCLWGTFSACWLLVADAPPGTQAAVFDVDAAFRNVLVLPRDRPCVAVRIGELVHLDHCLNFGIAPAPGVFGRIADLFMHILLKYGIDALIKWVDDFIFFRYPKGSRDGKYWYSYSEDLVWSVTESLGWPWSREKFVPFSSSFTYIGFNWDLERKSVSLPLAKRTKYLARLRPWVLGYKASRVQIEILIGTLNHVVLVITDGRSHLPSLYRFRATFKQDSPSWVMHRATAALAADVEWWITRLSSTDCCLAIVRPPPPLSSQLYVDASTSWGIGFVLDDRWLAWPLIPGWKADERDIGWAEMVAVELAVRVLVAAGFHDCHLILHSDNAGVVGALQAGRSRNPPQNAILRRIVALFQDNALWISTVWVASADNPADLPSRGLAPPARTLFAYPPAIPSHLRLFVLTSVLSLP